MPKMYPLNKTTAERRAENDAMGGPGRAVAANAEDKDGPVLHLDHHHLNRMGAGELRGGDRIAFHGEGEVEHASTETSDRGERRSARIRMNHGAMEHDGEREGGKKELRNEIEAIHGKAEAAKPAAKSSEKTGD